MDITPTRSVQRFTTRGVVLQCVISPLYQSRALGSWCLPAETIWLFGIGGVLGSCSYVGPFHVSTSRTRASPQELDEGDYRNAEFVDDHTLLLSLESSRNAPPSLVMMDTLVFVGGPPIRTSCRFSDFFKPFGAPYLLLERGAHKPTPAESSAPFHRDPTQRIAVLCFQSAQNHLVLLLGDLLKLLKSREGSDIGWNEWKTHVIMISPKVCHKNPLVSGCRLFFTYPTHNNPGLQMKVYDFSMQGRARYLCEWPSEELEIEKHMTTTEAKAQIPWTWVRETYVAHDSIIFTHVSVIVPCPLLKED